MSNEEYLSRLPTEEEDLERQVAPYRDLSPEERLAELADLQRTMEALLGERRPHSADGEPPLSDLWRDPLRVATR